jgi:hypothetical protein
MNCSWKFCFLRKVKSLISHHTPHQQKLYHKSQLVLDLYLSLASVTGIIKPFKHLLIFVPLLI